jgi:hypothetical protein
MPKSMEALVSILIPAYNAQVWIADAIESAIYHLSPPTCLSYMGKSEKKDALLLNNAPNRVCG